jgi:hypothetical protein
VHGRNAEHADDGIADEFLDDPAERVDRLPRHARVRPEHPVHVFGIR